MLNRIQDYLRRKLHTQSLKSWDKAVRTAETMDLSSLRDMRTQAKQLRKSLDQITHTAEDRLALPRIGSNAIRKPVQADWAYRPEIWHQLITPVGIAAAQNKSKIGNAAAIYHDCQTSELTLRQVRNSRKGDLAPYGLRFDIFKFDGSFLSLLIDLPDSAIKGLRRNHILRMTAEIESEKPLKIIARLNIKYGPNVEQAVRDLPVNTDDMTVEFDLEHTQLNENRLERIWMDLIFEGPELNEINLRDLTFSRRPRADF